MVFKKLNGIEVELADYIQHYIDSVPEVEILIGCDSQNMRRDTVYAVVVGLYRPGKGAHIVFRRWKTKKEYVRPVRLLNEVWYSVEVAEYLTKAGIKKPKWIDIDISPDPRYKSNEVFRQAVGLVEGLGYHVRYKTLGPVMTYACDHLVKS